MTLSLADAARQVLANVYVLTVGSNTPAVGPAAGDRHVVGTAPTGAWAAHPDAIAYWNGAAWIFADPTASSIFGVFNAATQAYYGWTGAAWLQVTVPPAGTSGTYTPTLTNVANLDASTAFKCQWMRVGNVVTVSGRVAVDPTTPTVSTQLGISLPIASNLGASQDCAGTAAASGIVSQCAAILGDATNNRAQMQWISTDATNQDMFFIFAYEVL